jgi:hypothetical protein
MTTKETAEKTVRDIRRKTRKQYSAEEKIRIVLEGLRGEGKEFLREDGAPIVLKFAVPGSVALEAAHSLFGIEDMRRRGAYPTSSTSFSKRGATPSLTPVFNRAVLKWIAGCSSEKAFWPTG